MMKKLLLPFFLLMTLGLNLKAQIVNIPDTNFKATLLADLAINLNGDTEIDSLEAQSFTGTIDVSSKSISDLTGIEAFTNLTRLLCFDNQLTSLNINQLTALTFLVCHHNQLTSLNLDFNTNLDTVSCSSNQLGGLDVSNNSLLKILACQQNQIDSLIIGNNTVLTTLFCSGNQLSSLNLTASAALEYLDCDNNLLSTLDLSNNTALVHLECEINQLSTLTLNAAASLKYLLSANNQLTNLNLNAYTALLFLRCSSNPLTAGLNIIGCTALETLEVQSTQLTTLDVTNNTALTTIKARNNDLDTMVLNSATALIYLDCSSNELVSFDVSGNLALETLKCNKNLPLLNLDVSGNPVLTYLDVSGVFLFTPSSLVSLNVKNGNNANFTFFKANWNSSLACIQVDDVAYSTANWTDINPTSSFSTNCSFTGLDPIEESMFNIFPNPANKQLMISVEGAFLPENLSIIDFTGKIIRTMDWTPNPINIEALNVGIYIVRLTSKNGAVLNEKFIKE